MIANYHTHTARCQHACGEDRAYVEEAIRGGIRYLGFSDHCPWVFADGYVSNIRMTPKELDDYIGSLCRLREEYRQDITIYIGFETEYIPSLFPEQDRLLQDYTIDYMILGQHFLDPEPHGTYTGSRTSDESFLARYVDQCIEGMETGRFLYLAHPDLIHFCGKREVYRTHMYRLCEYLYKRGIPIEINLLGYHCKRNYPNHQFLEIAREVGNKAILGCDAHDPKFLSDREYVQAGVKICEEFGIEIVETLQI